MGILNVTPDSFYDGGRFVGEAAILKQTEKMLSEGVDFIDVGGYSSRPGAMDISVDEEKGRIVQAVSSIAKTFPGTIISIDTFRSAVAEAAVDSGALMINDIAGGSLDPEMFKTVSRLKVPYIVMHMKGNPQTMGSQTQYTDLIKELLDYFHQKIHRLRELEVKDIIIDPGFGFSKTVGQNFNILHDLEKFSIIGRPVLVGLSRKSMIWKTLEMEAAGALNGTTALNMLALLKGADILRVHDVREAREVIKLFTSVRDNVKG
ncbi:MAG TPA: dihydropteroate synthase [Chryseosolibacter sp.]|nr:dihydropteroate synthase [Chryseosolibacter sp.]